MAGPRTHLVSTVLGTPDPHGLAVFYRDLLGLEIRTDEPDWVTVRTPDGLSGLSFQLEEDYEPPVWPQEPGRQQMMMHLDIEAEDVDAAVAFAIGLGAREAPVQPQRDVRVMLDPAGHPFCLFAS